MISALLMNGDFDTGGRKRHAENATQSKAIDSLQPDPLVHKELMFYFGLGRLGLYVKGETLCL